ncbi:protein farnesyltransferase subunit beta isoform X2 [Silene latifolia]|uniref:protein farnesyltransferase subunit beta isoform X2 n=1 Tax=Silene latifolia TaxID=37657 RepID=UPI003D76A929
MEEIKATVTETEQRMVESHVFSIFHHFSQLPQRPQSVMLEIARDSHSHYLTTALRRLPPSFCVLDANRPWLCYWILHSLALLREPIDDALENDAIDFLSKCQDPNGGYGGGPGQMPHLATTYAAVNSLITLGGHKALSSIHRDALYAFLQRMKDPNGSFRMHEKGETDVRACYTAIATASILNILDCELVENVGTYIASCQTYEGGIAGEPGSEAHGGYTFCGLATMVLIDEVHRLDLHALIGAVFPLIQRLEQLLDKQSEVTCTEGKEIVHQIDLAETECALPKVTCVINKTQLEQEAVQHNRSFANISEIGLDFLKKPVDGGILFHNIALQQYIILCSQVLDGGFRDKPGKSRDFYHTCYCLSGLSVCQYMGSHSSPLPQQVLGPDSNLLEPTHPLYNLVLERYNEAREFFTSL